jgi:hypothetical protein
VPGKGVLGSPYAGSRIAPVLSGQNHHGEPSL